MAVQSTYIGIEPRSLKCNSAVGRGLRVTRTAGVVGLSVIGVRGDFIALTDGESGQMVACASLQGGGKVPAVASETCAVDDPAYSAAAGQVSKTAAGAILLGRWTQGATVGVLGEIELLNPL